MKKLSLILLSILFAITGVLAQTPNEFKYQAVLRNADGTIIVEESVTVDISILQGSESGISVFDETHSVTTTAQGLINLNIGSVEDLSILDFSADTYFIEISINSTVMGTSQLLSVPYALTAKNVENDLVDDADADPTNEFQDLFLNGTFIEISDGTGVELYSIVDGSETIVTAGENVTVSGIGTTTDPYIINATSSGPTHYVGELFGGGIVFWVDETGEQGLIASLDDLDGGNGVYWSATQIFSQAGAYSMTDGATNTAAMVAQDPTAGYAATLCNSYDGGGFTDWYLPANRELYLLCSQDFLIDNILDNDGDDTTNGFIQELDGTGADTRYWSSTEFANDGAWYYVFKKGSSTVNSKGQFCRVRAIRAF